MRVDGELSGILVEPGTSHGGALHPALAVALTPELDPHDAVDMVVARLGGRGLAEAGLDVAPFLAGVGEGDAALVHDKASGEPLGLDGRGQGVDVAAFAEGVAVLASGGEGYVVGDVGGEAADPRAGAGLGDNVGKLGGGYMGSRG